jgi:hypothetical protein
VFLFFLQDIALPHLSYIYVHCLCPQLKEFASFDFDVWRKKYMRWMNHKKSRVMDFFRRIDKDQDGKITRQEFIDGILASSMFFRAGYTLLALFFAHSLLQLKC